MHPATESEFTIGTVDDDVPTGSATVGAALAELVAPAALPEPIEEAPTPEPVAEPRDFTEFYGLRENPFPDSVNPRLYYRTDTHDEACVCMMMAVRHNISLGLVTGRSGTGKTLLSQIILQELDAPEYQPILVLVTPAMSKTALLCEILSELQIEIPERGLRTQEMIGRLQDYIIDLHHHDRKLVILIDECHFLSAESLHTVRTISNIEIPERKLATCLLFGEERFLRRLRHPSYESLRTRIYLRSELRPLDESGLVQYMKFRLLMAGRREDLYDAGAFAALQTHSDGMCRGLNKLGLLTLLAGFRQRAPRITEEIVNTCAAAM